MAMSFWLRQMRAYKLAWVCLISDGRSLMSAVVSKALADLYFGVPWADIDLRLGPK
jgi:hypothetical protein